MRDTDPSRDEPLALTLASLAVRERAGTSCRVIAGGTVANAPGHLQSDRLDTQFHTEENDVELKKKIVLGAVREAGPPVEVARLGPRATLEAIQDRSGGSRFTSFTCSPSRRPRGITAGLLLANDDGTGERGRMRRKWFMQSCRARLRRRSCIWRRRWMGRRRMSSPPSVRIRLARLLMEAGVQAVVAIQSPISL